MRKVSWFAIIVFIINLAAFIGCTYVWKDINMQIFHGIAVLAIFIYIENRTEK